MGIDIDSKEYTWIIKHIKVINLYEIEKHAFIGNNIINELIISIDKDGPFDYSLSECPSGEIVNSDLMKFKERMGDTIKAFGECIRNDNTAIALTLLVIIFAKVITAQSFVQSSDFLVFSHNLRSFLRF